MTLLLEHLPSVNRSTLSVSEVCVSPLGADECIGAAGSPKGQDSEWSVRHCIPLSYSHLTEGKT